VKLTCIPKTTVHRHLTSLLRFIAKHLPWVPHELTETQKCQRANLDQLLHELCSMKHQGWQFMITRDEPWSHFAAGNEQIWLRRDQKLPKQARDMIEDRKITVLW
jgi:hypothetical protein